MFKASHEELISTAIFRPNTSLTSRLKTVEAWKYSGEEDCNESNFRNIAIQDEQVVDWLGQKGEFEPLPSPTKGAVLEGAIRLLFCTRTDYRPPGFGMSKESFLAVEKEFNLPPSTLQSIFNYQGTFSKQFGYSGQQSLNKVGFVIKAPQKMPIANYVLALSHNFSTKTTTAFIHGAMLHTSSPIMNFLLLCQPMTLYIRRPRSSDMAMPPLAPLPTQFTQSSQIISRIQHSIMHWTNPMLLLVLLLENYTFRSHLFAWDLDDQVVALERQTGVVFAGRTAGSRAKSHTPESIPRDKIQVLTEDMHSVLTEIIFFERVVAWIVDCSSFLEKSIGEMDLAGKGDGMIEILEFLGHISATATGMCGFQKSLKERVQSQINVLYSFIAQIDNSISAKIAVSSAQDSRAMKTLALITTVFLPGTYVATLFSMSMFSWSQASSDTSASSIVSSRFWIYWVVTIPLTIFVIVCWRVWWLWQESAYQKAVDAAVQEGESEESSASINDFDATSVIWPDRGSA